MLDRCHTKGWAKRAHVCLLGGISAVTDTALADLTIGGSDTTEGSKAHLAAAKKTHWSVIGKLLATSPAESLAGDGPLRRQQVGPAQRICVVERFTGE
jgi:hypothetical protein